MLNKEFVYLPVEHQLAAGQIVDVNIFAAHLYIKEISSTPALQISVDGSKFGKVFEGTHFDFSGNSFGQVKFRNYSAATISFTALFCSQNIIDSSIVLTGSLAVKDVANSLVTTDVINVGTLAARAADTTRREIIIQNNGTAAVWIGDSSVAVGRGYKLDADKSVVLATTDELYFTASTGTQAVNITELKDA